MLDSLLDRLARSRGIGEAYHDYRGELRAFSPATKTAILAAMGCNVTDATAVEQEIRALDAGRWRSLLPPVAVLRTGHAGVVLALPADALDQLVAWRVRKEDGAELSGEVQASELAAGQRDQYIG